MMAFQDNDDDAKKCKSCGDKVQDHQLQEHHSEGAHIKQKQVKSEFHSM